MIHTLGRLLVLRGFESADELGRERRRALLSTNPFNSGGTVTALEMDSYTPFPFLPPVKAGVQGTVYEFRTYRLKLPACADCGENDRRGEHCERCARPQATGGRPSQ